MKNLRFYATDRPRGVQCVDITCENRVTYCRIVGRFEGLTAIPLRIQVIWDVMLCLWVRRFPTFRWNVLPLSHKILRLV